MIFFSNKCGQLGNRLFSFAHLIAHAKAHNLKLINLSFDEYAQFFQTTSQDIFSSYPTTPTIFKNTRLRAFLFVINKIILKLLRAIRINRSPIHSIIIADLPEYQFKEARYLDLNTLSDETLRKKNAVFLFGRFFRDYKNLELHQDVVRSYFRPIAKIEKNVNLLIEKTKPGSDLLIGVHIRRGDYKLFSEGKYFYDQEQYYGKMKELQSSIPGKNLKFIICSNEEIQSKNFPDVNFVRGTGHLVEDMYALSRCDFILGPPSTFTLWASFYGNKPLYQIFDITQPATLDSFKILPPHILYNFSFN